MTATLIVHQSLKASGPKLESPGGTLRESPIRGERTCGKPQAGCAFRRSAELLGEKRQDASGGTGRIGATIGTEHLNACHGAFIAQMDAVFGRLNGLVGTEDTLEETAFGLDLAS